MLSYTDLYKFYLACGMNDKQAREAAKNYMRIQDKFYGENNE